MMMSAAQKSFPRDIKSLTSLRFFAAFAIVLFHFSILLPDHIALHKVTNQWWLGVDFFFILSGFILTHAHMDEISAKAFSRYNFYIKRLARIYPLHFFTGVLTGMAVFYTLLNGSSVYIGYSASCIGTSFFLLHAWGLGNGYCLNLPSWSLSAEWFAYLLFPFLAAVFHRRSPEIMFALSLLLFLLLFLGFAAFFDKSLTSATYDFGILRILPEFMIGMSLRHLGEKYTFGKSAGYIVFVSFILICLSLFFGISSFFIVLFLAALIFSAADLERQKTYWLCSVPMVYLGKLSFALYLVSYPVTTMFSSLVYEHIPIEIRELDRDFLLVCSLSLLVMFPATLLFHHDVEEPAQRWICKKFLRPSLLSDKKPRKKNEKTDLV